MAPFSVISAMDTGSSILNAMGTILLLVVSLLSTTFVYTTLRFWIQSWGDASRNQGKEPPMLPYVIPYFGAILRMQDPHAMYNWALKISRNAKSVSLRIGPLKFYLLFGSKNVAMIFKNSKSLSKELTNKFILRASGMDDVDQNMLLSDNSGLNTVSETDIPPAQRLWKRFHDLNGTHLSSGKAVSKLTNLFIEEFSVQCDKEPLNVWATTPIYDFLKNRMFTAGATALVGTRIFDVNPDFVKIYWDYDDVFLPLMVGLPRLLSPDMYRKRDRMLKASQKWIKAAHERFDMEKAGDAEWEPNFGSEYIRKTVMIGEEAGVSRDGQGALLLSVIWATNSNSIPAATWVILEALQRPNLLDRLRAEISTAAAIGTDGKLSIDVPKLITLPLLTSMYLEVLRIRSSMTMVRQLTEDLESDGYVLKKGAFIMSPTWIPHRSPQFWAAGPAQPSPDDFWPERFVEMARADDPTAKPRLAAAMRPENFFPYGGGNVICAGRFFAKQEIMAVVAVLVMKFDFDFHSWVLPDGTKSEGAAGLADGYAGGGVTPPDRDMMVRMRRRV